MPKLWFQAETARDRLLPLVCPSCLAAGVRALPVPTLGPDPLPAVDAYYCERCADHLERARTVRAARWASSALAGVGAATTSALALGGSRLGLQICLTLFAAFVPLLLAGVFQTPAESALYQAPAGPPDVLRWLVRERGFLEALGARPAPAAPPGQARSWQRELAPVLVALAWLGGLHWLGRTELRVIHAGDSDAIVLLDQRRQRSIGPTRTEHPHAARAIGTLAGRRVLGLVSERGEVLADVTATLLPGRDYVFGTLPEGSCLFVERKEYGGEGEAHELIALAGSGPLWELPVNIDVWFAPLRERSALPTSGGVRAALRLRACH